MKKRYLALTMAVCLVLAVVVGNTIIKDDRYAMISLDINPSLELIINEDEEVIEIIPLNGDAKKVYTDDMIGQNVMVVIEDIIENAEALDYLTEKNNNILISSAVYDEDDDSNLDELITEYIEENIEPDENVRIIYIESDQEMIELAEKRNISLGRLALNELSGQDNDEDETVTDIVEDEEVALAIEPNVVLDDMDDLKASYLEFMSKLSFVDEEDMDAIGEEVYNQIVEFFELIDGLEKDDQDVPVEFPDEYPSLVLLKNAAKDLWRLVQDDYQKEWALTQPDEIRFNEGDMKDLEEWLTKLDMLPDYQAYVAEVRERMDDGEDLKALKEEVKGIFFEAKDNDENKELWSTKSDDKEELDGDSDDDAEDVLKELDKLDDKYGEEEGVQEFIEEIMLLLEGDSPDYEDLEKQVEEKIDSFKEDDEEDNDAEDVLKELDKLDKKYGEEEGVQEFIEDIMALLEGDSPDYEDLEDQVEEKIDSFKDEDEDSDDGAEGVLEELDELNDKYGEEEGVQEFIAEITALLEADSPDYEDLKERVKDKIHELEELAEPEEADEPKEIDEAEDKSGEVLSKLNELLNEFDEYDLSAFEAEILDALAEETPDFEALKDRIENKKDELKSREEGEKKVREKLSKLEDEFGDVDGVEAFILDIESQLSAEAPDYDALKDLVEDKFEELKDSEEDDE